MSNHQRFQQFVTTDVHEIDILCTYELMQAGIEANKLPECIRSDTADVRTIVFGELHHWTFKRARKFWIAEGPGLPPAYSNALHEKIGQECRVNGDCTCPSPTKQYGNFASGYYHVDTQEALNELAKMLNRCAVGAGANDNLGGN